MTNSRLLTRTALLAAVLSLSVSTVHAHHHADDDCVADQADNSEIPLTVTVNIGRDATAGENTAIGPWFTFPKMGWTCIRKASKDFVPANDSAKVEVNMAPGTTSKADVDLIGTLDGYGLYQTTDKIGYIARVQYQMLDLSTEMTPITAKEGDGTRRPIETASTRKDGESFRFFTTLQVRLVRLHNPKAKGDLQNGHSKSFRAMRFRLYTRSRGNNSEGHKDLQTTHYYRLNFTIANIAATCTTPPQHVDLGEVSETTLRRNGHGPSTDFGLAFQNCPPYLRSVKYRFTPSPAHASASNGVLPLLAPSTATGAAVQVLDADGITPLAFDPQFTRMADYEPHQTPQPVYQIPLKARIIRTHGPLNGGTVHAAMRMVVEYR